MFTQHFSSSIFFLPGHYQAQYDSDNITFRNSTMTAVAHSSPHFVSKSVFCPAFEEGSLGSETKVKQRGCLTQYPGR
jgi:hypothetical protein